jgi:hypothetical protein
MEHSLAKIKSHTTDVQVVGFSETFYFKEYLRRKPPKTIGIIMKRSMN